jgi:hypothetical protein
MYSPIQTPVYCHTHTRDRTFLPYTQYIKRDPEREVCTSAPLGQTVTARITSLYSSSVEEPNASIGPGTFPYRETQEEKQETRSFTPESNFEAQLPKEN